jgi:hypothetical protein
LEGDDENRGGEVSRELAVLNLEIGAHITATLEEQAQEGCKDQFSLHGIALTGNCPKKYDSMKHFSYARELTRQMGKKSICTLFY